MKKILIYILSFIMLFFIFPAICTITPKREKVQETVSNEEKNVEEQKEEAVKQEEYAYQKYKTIKLLHTSTGEVEELNIDEYLYGVVSS